MLEVHLSDFAHNVGQWIILNHAIVYDDRLLHLRVRSPYIQSLCKNARTSRTEFIFIKIQIQVIVQITFRIQVEIN